MALILAEISLGAHYIALFTAHRHNSERGGEDFSSLDYIRAFLSRKESGFAP